MEKVFVDTTIVIDLLAKREPFYKDAQDLFTLSDRKEIQLQISSLTFANAYYSIVIGNGRTTVQGQKFELKMNRQNANASQN